MKGKPPENISRYYGVNLFGIVLAFVVFSACAGTLTYVAERTGASSVSPPGESADNSDSVSIATLSEQENDDNEDSDLPPGAVNEPVVVTLPADKSEGQGSKKTGAADKKKSAAVASKPQYKQEPKRKTQVAAAPSKKQAAPSKIISEKDIPRLEEPSGPKTVERVDPSTVKGVTPLWYSIQVGYTDSKMRADILRDVLRQQGFGEADTVATGEGTYFVSVGKYSFRYAADEAAKKIQDKTNLIPRIYEKTIAE